MSFHYLTLCRWQLKIGFRHCLKWHWITLNSKGGLVSLQLLLPRWQHIDQLLWKAEVDLENVEDMYLRQVFFRWELWPNPPESQVIVWSFQNLARDVFGSFLFHNTHMTPRGCHVWSETDGRHIDNQKETYSLGRWFGKLNSLHNIGRPEIFRWIMRVMFLEFSITKRNVGFRVVAKDDWWYVPLRTILPLRTVNFWSTNIHPSHRFASWLQPKSDQNFLRPRGRVKQMSTGGFFQSFRYVSLTVETSNES